MRAIAARGADVAAALKQLPPGRLSSTDLRKVDLLGESFRRQLARYDFGSFSNSELRIDHDDLLPKREDFDLQADISASDTIRVIWAYLIALLETSREMTTNHLGFLLFDEPRQQSAKAESFAALLRYASEVANDDQVIFITSEEEATLRAMLKGVPHALTLVDGFLLKPTSA
jgi:hypothetical protein